jgi:hypothetical protein
VSNAALDRFDRTPDPWGVLMVVGLALALAAWALLTGRVTRSP